MPGKSGIDTTAAIMTMNPVAKVMLLSPLENELVIMKSLEAGARDFMQKPFTKDTLVKALKSLE